MLFKLISGFDNFELFGDALRYDFLSENILNGNQNLDITAFVTAPLYPYLIALFKIIGGEYWQLLAVSYNFILVSLSAVYIYKISMMLFKQSGWSYLAVIIYIFYPLTLWYNFSITQETSFQSYFIIFSYFFILFLEKNSWKHVLLSATFFSLAALTKSHIQLLIPFILILSWYYTAVRKMLVFMVLLLLFQLPQAYLNWYNHGIFSYSSFGDGSLFLAGHSAATYPCLSKEIEKFPDIKAQGCDLDIIFHPPYKFDNYGQVNVLPVNERNRIRYQIAWEWIRTNPDKFLELKWNALKRFVIPGLDSRIYDSFKWWVSLLSGLIIYLPAWIGIYFALRKNDPASKYILSVYLVIAIIFIVFYPQNRFRVITLEPLLIVYSVQGMDKIVKFIRRLIFAPSK